MRRKWMTVLFLSLGILLISYSLSVTENVLAEGASKKNEAGRKLFMQYCATCHGAEARGDGPTAKMLKKAPADLTRIEKQNGKFPAMRIQRVITGDDMLESHGSRDMPVWGTILRRKSGHGFATLEIYNLTKYIESIQQE
jgi:mono/diheme cytochrome c family protein